MLYKEFSHDRDCDEPDVGLKIESNIHPCEELKNAINTPQEFSDKIGDYFRACEKKFADYTSARRILLFNFVSSELFFDCDQNWWEEFFGIHKPTTVDMVVIGSGIAGLSCAALLARYGFELVVCESHTITDGATHSFERDGFKFDSGPLLQETGRWVCNCGTLKEIELGLQRIQRTCSYTESISH
jgi:NAD(P)-binding Rossmann-like domain